MRVVELSGRGLASTGPCKGRAVADPVMKAGHRDWVDCVDEGTTAGVDTKERREKRKGRQSMI